MKRIVSVYLPLWPIERLQTRMRNISPASPSSAPFSRSGDPRTRLRPVSGQTRGATHGKPDEPPLVLIDQASPRGLLVHACNARALADGIREGEALADVRARVPGLITRPADLVADRTALEALVLWCGRYGPSVNVDATGGSAGALWVDITGVAHLFGGEEQMLADLARRLSAFQLTARLGLASSLAAASAIARYARNDALASRIAPEGGAAATLADLPVESLRLDRAPLLLLRRLGLKRIGQLYDLPRAALKRRFPSREAAHAVLLRLDQALGRAAEPLVALRPAPRHAVRRAFSEPLISSEGLISALDAAVRELCAMFAAHQSGARQLVLTLYRSDGTYLEQVAGFSAPTRRPAHVLRLLGERLERIEESGSGSFGVESSALLGLGIDAFVLAATRTQDHHPVQTGLLGADGGPAVSMAALVDRLVNRLGSQRVQRLAPRASHIPERAQTLVPALDPDCSRSLSAPSSPVSELRMVEGGTAMLAGLAAASTPPAVRVRGPPRPCLLLGSPEPILVTAEIPEGAPVRFTWRRIIRRVVRAEGPERISPEWWRELSCGSPVCGRIRTRDYYQLEDDSGARYWVFRDGLYQGRGEGDAAPSWYVHGLYA